MVAAFRRKRGFANQPLALRRCILQILSRRDRLTARDIASAAYGWRVMVRPGYVLNVTPSELVATRRALRALVAKGRVEELRRYRRWKVFVVRKEVRPAKQRTRKQGRRR